ncbi:MAG: hypothetical protein U5L09_11485, partial [Bacteroidales bacterium]|nr:hypothetical protein [Bacteroidales bacterium]
MPQPQDREVRDVICPLLYRLSRGIAPSQGRLRIGILSRRPLAADQRTAAVGRRCTNNPAPCIHPDGSVLLAYRDLEDRCGVSDH